MVDVWGFSGSEMWYRYRVRRRYRVRGRCRVCSTVIGYRRRWMGLLNV